MPNAAEPVMEDTKGDRCPRCLQTVPPKASRCPGCGQPIGSMRSLAFAIGIAGLLVLVFAMIVMFRLAGETACATNGKSLARIGGACFSLPTPVCGRISSRLGKRVPDPSAGLHKTHPSLN